MHHLGIGQRERSIGIWINMMISHRVLCIRDLGRRLRLGMRIQIHIMLAQGRNLGIGLQRSIRLLILGRRNIIQSVGVEDGI